MATEATKRHLVIAIECGETTCASAPGKFCQYVRTSHFGKRFSCHLFGALREDVPLGWLQRHADCIATERKEGSAK